MRGFINPSIILTGLVLCGWLAYPGQAWAQTVDALPQNGCIDTRQYEPLASRLSALQQECLEKLQTYQDRTNTPSTVLTASGSDLLRVCFGRQQAVCDALWTAGEENPLPSPPDLTAIEQTRRFTQCSCQVRVNYTAQMNRFGAMMLVDANTKKVDFFTQKLTAFNTRLRGLLEVIGGIDKELSQLPQSMANQCIRYHGQE